LRIGDVTSLLQPCSDEVRLLFTMTQQRPWRERFDWDARWIGPSTPLTPPFVSAYRLAFSSDTASDVLVDVSADERYILFLDGQIVGRGPERGAPSLWFYETVTLALTPGEHTLVAQVWAYGPLSPQAQMSVAPGFLLRAHGSWHERLSTGCAAWSFKQLRGYSFRPPVPAFWKGASVDIDGARFDWGFESGAGDSWTAPAQLTPGTERISDWELAPRHRLTPAALPAQLERPIRPGAVKLVTAPGLGQDTGSIPLRLADVLDRADWQRWLADEGVVTLPAHTTRRVLIDLDNYHSLYASLTVSGGAGSLIRVLWAESLYLEPDFWKGGKGHRDEIDGRYFLGMGDVYRPDGGAHRRFSPLWWGCGRFIEILVLTADAPLTLQAIDFIESRYPLENESHFNASDARLPALLPLLTRGIQMTAHDTYCDGPWWEEMMYLGDTRLEALCTYVMTRDVALPQKALMLFDHSRFPNGLTHSRFPTRLPQLIAPFSLWWVLMACDHAYWRDSAFVRTLMPGVRQTMQAYERHLNTDGLIDAPEGWNCFDWVPSWDSDAGTPPDGVSGVSGLINWHYIFVLTRYADLEAKLGEPELAARAERQAAALASRAAAAFFVPQRGVMSDTLTHDRFSEHTQCMALLASAHPAVAASFDTARVLDGLRHAPDLDRATIYFSHYLFETCQQTGAIDILFKRMTLWFDLLDLGLKTPVESPRPRSDCHGWGAHPLYHLYATVLGIRPSALDFSEVTVQPQLGPLTHASCTLIHPKGEIVVEARRVDGRVDVQVRAPEGVRVTLQKPAR
jgi:alpha-L-rhamnosidase